MTPRVPTELVRGSSRVLRPNDGERVYAHPRPEFARLERSGALRRVAAGHYAVVPDDRVGVPWVPELEAMVLAVMVSAGGVESAALMGVSAVRVRGALPRALSMAVVAVARLDVQRHRTDLVEGWGDDSGADGARPRRPPRAGQSIRRDEGCRPGTAATGGSARCSRSSPHLSAAVRRCAGC